MTRYFRRLWGIGVLKRLQEGSLKPTVYNGPIVVLSNLGQDEVIKTAVSLRAKGYLVKSGMNPDEALNKISEFIRTASSTTQVN